MPPRSRSSDDEEVAEVKPRSRRRMDLESSWRRGRLGDPLGHVLGLGPHAPASRRARFAVPLRRDPEIRRPSPPEARSSVEANELRRHLLVAGVAGPPPGNRSRGANPAGTGVAPGKKALL